MQTRFNYFPNLFIPAAQKSGTTSLYLFLKLHPRCLVQKRHSYDMLSEASRRKRLNEYWKTFPISDPQQTEAYKYICDTTPHYLFQENFSDHLKKIKKKDIKFIILLRQPLERAHSAYWHMKLNGEEKRSEDEVFRFDGESKKEIIKQEKRKLRTASRNGKIDLSRTKKQYDDALWNFRYLENSFYSEHLKTFLEKFKNDNIEFLFTRELKNQPEKSMERVCDFLEIKTIPPRTFFSSPTKPTLIPRFHILSKALKKFLQKFSESSKILRRLIEKVLYRRRPQLDQRYKKRLQSALEEEYSDLGVLLSRTPPDEWIQK